jgi:hypothetical protein
MARGAERAFLRRMRAPLAAALGAIGLSFVSLVSLSLPTACLPREQCNAVCEPIIAATAHLPGTAASLGRASVTFCRNGACASGTFGAASDAGGAAFVQLTGAPFTASAQLTDEGDGFTLVGISLVVSGFTETDGDTYAVHVTDAGGKTLLDVTRPVTYDVVPSCGPTCHDYSLNIYPTSASGIACGDKVCTSGADFSGELDTSDFTDSIVLKVCRNGACGTATTVLPVSFSDGLSGTLEGALTATWGVQELSMQSPRFDFQIEVRDDPAALSDADTYTVTITQGTTTLASFSGVAPYQTSTPNGAQCDVFPCRFATVTVH